MNTGEDIHGLRKIIDLTRLISITILVIHFYLACYQAFAAWHWTTPITDRIIGNIAKTGLFTNWFKPKLASLLFLIISLIGDRYPTMDKIDDFAYLKKILKKIELFFFQPAFNLLHFSRQIGQPFQISQKPRRYLKAFPPSQRDKVIFYDFVPFCFLVIPCFSGGL